MSACELPLTLIMSRSAPVGFTLNLVEDIQDISDKVHNRCNRAFPELTPSHKEKQTATPRVDPHESKQNEEPRPCTVATKTREPFNGANLYKAVGKEKVRGKGKVNPLAEYGHKSKCRRRRFVAGKARANTVASQQKAQAVPFETGLDAEFLNLFAK
eukprot:TRINITY_DN8079_c0_g1_i21.p2 TRINITY_DN8079_c0_g1~~TRINITY_DN8079_c0_g1_i21.p2  ORF type:complete len:157 (+),score=5.05 TRINITY_DN8079_c0_g1_i21:676-1146(+)